MDINEIIYNAFWVSLYIFVLVIFFFWLFSIIAAYKRNKYEKKSAYNLTFLHIKLPPDNEIEIKDSVILNIINAERKNLTEKFRKDEMNKEYEFDIAFIEENIFDVKLNGYSVSDYRGKRAKSLEVSFATTMSSYKILKKIDSIVLKEE